ncbi:glycine cleavage system protein GcvH [Kitasatospora nipponensis]|uniref:Glycine cleavage system H protein n=1 Tax=Kitasatospora nipponensis TaxID=258049 RepID=A0ABP4GSA3_9ACTN
MANVPNDRKYTKDHEWVLTTGDGRVKIGITDYAQKQLGDIVFVELPNAGDTFEAGQPLGSIESVKSVSEVYSPLAGTVAAVNESLNDEPEEVNSDAFGNGWLVEITLSKGSTTDGLLTAAEYEQYISSDD